MEKTWMTEKKKNNRDFFGGVARTWLDWQNLRQASSSFVDLADGFDKAMGLTEVYEDEFAPCHLSPERVDKLVFVVEDAEVLEQISDQVPTPSLRIDADKTYLVYLLDAPIWVNQGNYQRIENTRQMVKNSLCHSFGLEEVDKVPFADDDFVTCRGLEDTFDSDGVEVEGLVRWRLDTLGCWQESHGLWESLRTDNQSARGGSAKSPAKEISSAKNAALGRKMRTLNKHLKLMRLEAMLMDCEWTDERMGEALDYKLDTLRKAKKLVENLELTEDERSEALAYAEENNLDIYPLNPDGSNIVEDLDIRQDEPTPEPTPKSVYNDWTGFNRKADGWLEERKPQGSPVLSSKDFPQYSFRVPQDATGAPLSPSEPAELVDGLLADLGLADEPVRDEPDDRAFDKLVSQLF